MVEPGRRKPGHRPYAPHRPEKQGDRLPPSDEGFRGRKIRILQHQKNQLVANVLGDEGFTSSLGIDDLNFILNHGDDEEG